MNELYFYCGLKRSRLSVVAVLCISRFFVAWMRISYTALALTLPLFPYLSHLFLSIFLLPSHCLIPKMIFFRVNMKECSVKNWEDEQFADEKKRNSLHLGELLRIHPLINFWIKLTSVASIMADCSLIIKCKPVRWQHVPVKSSELSYNLKNCFAEGPC